MDKKYNHLKLVIQKSLENSLNSEEAQFLRESLMASPEARQYYIDFVRVHGSLFLISDELLPGINDRNLDAINQALLDLSLYENTAPVTESPRNETPKEIIQKVERPNHEYKINRSSLYTIMTSIAAVLLVALFVHFVPARGKSFAYVIEEYQAELEGPKTTLNAGQYLDDMPIKLNKGLLKIQMNDGSVVLLEAPTEVRLENNDQLFLISGKLTARVPKEAVGFTVRTPSASIIDYGTEFGVLVDQYAETETHVLKGNVKLGVGSNPRILEQTIRLFANQAGSVSGQTLKRIPAKSNQFVYNIPSPFERMAKSLGASMYLHLQSDSIHSFGDVMSAVTAENIEIKDNVSIVPGPFYTDGNKSYALRMEGHDSAIKVSNIQSIPQSRDGDYSIGCWIRFDEIKQQMIYSGNVPQQQGFRLRSLLMNEEGALRHFSSSVMLSGNIWGVSSPNTLRAGQWYFIMIARNAGDVNTKHMYINGKRVARSIAENEAGNGIKQFDSLQFGGDVGTQSGFEGEIADILLFPKALNDKEARLLYESASGIDRR